MPILKSNEYILFYSHFEDGVTPYKNKKKGYDTCQITIFNWNLEYRFKLENMILASCFEHETHPGVIYNVMRYVMYFLYILMFGIN